MSEDLLRQMGMVDYEAVRRDLTLLMTDSQVLLMTLMIIMVVLVIMMMLVPMIAILMIRLPIYVIKHHHNVGFITCIANCY